MGPNRRPSRRAEPCPGKCQSIDLGSAPAATFYLPAETAERSRGTWGAQNPPYLTLWGHLPPEKSCKIEQQATHTTNVFGAEA